MIRPRNEHTIAAECEITGRGYWSGRAVRVRFRPNIAGSGIRFVRTDLNGSPSCQANTQHSSGLSMRTNLDNGSASFQMVEHVMSALYSLEIDNCYVETDAEELPGLDGSSGAYVEALQAVGMVMQAAARKRFIVDRTLRVGTPEAWVEVSPSTRGCASFEYRLDYGISSPIQEQVSTHLLTPSNYCREIAWARTFVTAEQADRLRVSGVGTHVTNQDLVVFDSNGHAIDNPLRFENECARHKTLDLIGDMAMAGVELVGKFVSFRGGHQLNSELAGLLAEFAACSHMAAGPSSQSAPPLALRPRAA